jgi:uncharacterized membrane protein
MKIQKYKASLRLTIFFLPSVLVLMIITGLPGSCARVWMQSPYNQGSGNPTGW